MTPEENKPEGAEEASDGGEAALEKKAEDLEKEQ